MRQWGTIRLVHPATPRKSISMMRIAGPAATCRRAAIAVALAGLACLVGAAASAQEVPSRDLYQERGRGGQGNKIVMCVNSAAMMASFDAALARELASALLLTAEVIEVKAWRPTEPLDYRLPLTMEEIYIQLAEQCDGFMGFTLAQGYPEWMTLTRPYLVSRTVIATKAPNVRKLADVPLSRPLGTRILGGVDNQVIMYLQSLPEKSRWPRLAYYNNKVLMDRLLDGTVAAAFVWEPALYRATNGKPEAAGVRIVPAPFDLYETEIGIAVRTHDAFLASTLGQAIDALRADGTIDRLLVEHGLAAPKPPGK
jgi:polar amino acid transport system substrate-binding protein